MSMRRELTEKLQARTALLEKAEGFLKEGKREDYRSQMEKVRNMARTIDSAKRVINGTYGEVWVDGEKIAECTACQGKVAKNKETINLCGQFMTDTKATSGSGTGSLTLYKVDSGFAQRQAGLQNGVDVRCTIISKLRDPDSYGAERVAFYNVSFDDLTLSDWQAATVGTVTAPFTFSAYELLDRIEVQ